MLAACIATGVDDIETFEARVKSALSSIKYKWVVILIANYHSQVKSVKYILDNFATIDILSKDIDFYFPGYLSATDSPIIPNRETIEKELLIKVIAQLHELSKEREVPIEKIKETESNLCKLTETTKSSDEENFHGDSKITEIYSKRLGKIRFSEESFANFVAELMKKSNEHYKYLGGCDLIMIPYFNDTLQYPNCCVFHLENITDNDTRISIDEFLLRVIDTLNMYNTKLEVPYIRGESFNSSMEKFNESINELKCLLNLAKEVPTSISNLVEQAESVICGCNKIFSRTFGKQILLESAGRILDIIRENRDFIVNQVVVRSVLEELYKEAIKEIVYPSENEMVEKIISDIERHVNWKLADEFYFISYSTKDKVKAELIRKLLQENGAKVWIAPDGIPQGRDYSMVIPTTLKYTKNFVLILTDNSARSKWVSREIDAAVNNGSTHLKIILADGFQIERLQNYPDIGFYLNKVQVSYRYEDIIQNPDEFKAFMK